MHHPFLITIAEWAWSTDPSPQVTPTVCLESLPFLSSPCFMRLLAKLIGISIIAASCINKAPVIRNIYTSKTAFGLSPTSTYSEVILYSNAAYYNLLRGNPFTAYGETFMVMIQTFIVVIMIWIYKEPRVKMGDVVVPLLVYGLYVYVVFRGKFHHE
jgi:hypothetical protein